MPSYDVPQLFLTWEFPPKDWTLCEKKPQSECLITGGFVPLFQYANSAWERRQLANRLIDGAGLRHRHEYSVGYYRPAAVGCGNYRLASQPYAVRSRAVLLGRGHFFTS
jgi:hypothetical protein